MFQFVRGIALTTVITLTKTGYTFYTFHAYFGLQKGQKYKTLFLYSLKEKKTLDEFWLFPTFLNFYVGKMWLFLQASGKPDVPTSAGVTYACLARESWGWVRPGWFALWSPHIAPWINMVSVQICWIFLCLSKIEFVACDVCDVACIACDKCDVTYIAYIAYIVCKKENLCLRLSKFLKTHQKGEVGLKVWPKCFFATTVNRFILFYCFAFLMKKKWEAGLILHSKTCFFLIELLLLDFSRMQDWSNPCWAW